MAGGKGFHIGQLRTGHNCQSRELIDGTQLRIFSLPTKKNAASAAKSLPRASSALSGLGRLVQRARTSGVGPCALGARARKSYDLGSECGRAVCTASMREVSTV